MITYPTTIIPRYIALAWEIIENALISEYEARWGIFPPYTVLKQEVGNGYVRKVIVVGSKKHTLVSPIIQGKSWEDEE